MCLARGFTGAFAVFVTIVPSATIGPPHELATEGDAGTQARSHRIAFAIVLSVTPNSTAIE